jgi:uncharacterized membrane protein
MTLAVVLPLNDVVRREGNIAGMTARTNPSRRWFAFCCLAISWALANWGAMVLQPFLTGWIFNGWWLLCAVLALLSVVLASIEVIASWRGFRAEQRRCRHDQREEIDKEAPGGTTDPRSGRPTDD